MTWGEATSSANIYSNHGLKLNQMKCNIFSGDEMGRKLRRRGMFDVCVFFFVCFFFFGGGGGEQEEWRLSLLPLWSFLTITLLRLNKIIT